jgi:DNA helicase-2/ATP-dependent DNA helicase PcrA
MQIEPEICIGPPGCGKTFTLLGVVDDELSNGTPPDRIGLVTFTRRAADEARERAAKKFGLTARQLPYFKTLHSLCFGALGLTSADVMEGKALLEFGDWIGVKVSGRGSLEEGSSFGFEVGDRVLFLINLARVRGVGLRQQYDLGQDLDLPWNLVERVARGLDEYKRVRGLIDFTDMLQTFVDSDWSARLDVLLVDEGQDLSALQWSVVARLAKGVRRLVVAGDDDQAIFRWAGADVEQLIAMRGRERVLGQSWRVPASVQVVAHEVLGRVKHRRPKEWSPRPEAGEVTRVQRLDDVDVKPGDDVLVLCRNSSYLRDDAAALFRSEGILFEWRGQPSVRGGVIDAVRLWERLRRGDAVTVDEAVQVYELMAAGEGYARGAKKLPGFTDREALVTLDQLKARGGLLTDVIWHDALTRVTLEERAYMLKALRRGEHLTRRPTVRLSTIHGSKGGQAEHVVLMRDMAFRSWREGEAAPEDEARVFYVGVTRAKQKLTIVAPQTRRSYDI